MNKLPQGPAVLSSFQVSVSSLTLGTLYEGVLAFSSQDKFETFWPSVCHNARWLIPARRMAILLSGEDGGFEVVGGFQQGKFHKVIADSPFTPKTDWLKRTLLEKRALWVVKPFEQLDQETGSFAQWLFRDRPELLFVLPMTMKGKAIGALLFVMAPVAGTDQSMLNTLGTIYALHVGMSYSLLQITEERRQMQDQLIMQDRMAALGNLVAGIAHEINNPLGAVQSAADVVMLCVKKFERLFVGDNAPEEIRNDEKCQIAFKALQESTKVMTSGGNRIAKIVRSLRSFTRLDEAERQKAGIHEGIESTLTLLQGKLKDRITVVEEYGDIPEIHCFPGQLNQVFVSLLQNAVDAIEGQGTIRIRTLRRGDVICVQISDSGRGILPEKLKTIFNFNFSQTGSRVKMGAGLVTAYNIIQKHRGDIKVDSELGTGSCFTITLPIR